MSILWRLVFFSRCTSTHHKLALDALRFVRGPQADLWANLFLSNHEQYLAGSKAPDHEFKDFKNHVLHVNDEFWGGATATARQWYQKTVAALSQGDWPEATYNAGVLSHYFTDPFQPFHTGQSEAEGQVHRAAEWSICKAYEELQAVLENDLNGYPECELTTRPDWLEEAIRQGALKAHESYEVCIDHYDLNRGIKDPPSGLDQELKDRVARLIGLAAVGFARVLERAIEESAASPPDVAVSLHVLLAGLKMPLNWIRRRFTDLRERAVIEAIYLEIQDKGKVIKALPADERTVRQLYAQEVLKIPVRQLDAEPAGTTGTRYGTGTPSRGTTIKAASSASFQRTVISGPRQIEIPRGPTVQLETCLMVPLAKEASPDIVADVAVRAYLKTQLPPDQLVPATAPGSQPSATVSSRIAERNIAPMSSPSPLTVPQSAELTGTRPSFSEPAVPSKSELDKAERRLQRQLSRQTDPEPALTPPALPVSLTNETHASLAAAEMPVDMFAPLPPMPRVSPREKNTPASTPASATGPAFPAERIPNAVPPTRTPPQVTVPNPVAATPVARPAQPTARVVPQPPSNAIPNSPRDIKTFSVQPAEQSVVPAPHVRLPEEAEANIPAVEFKNRLTSGGQATSFDFQTFSGVTPPATAFPPTVPTSPRPSPPIPPNPGTAAVQPPVASPQPAHTSDPSASRRFYLELHSPVVDAPSIGPKTAERMHSIGIHTIADFLTLDPGQAAEKLGNRAATDLVRDWQDQSRLVCCIPNLRGHDAQFLVACQVRTAEQLRAREPRQLLQQVEAFLGTTTGQRLLRGGKPPNLAEVTEWIVAARDARSIR